jgi:transposase
VNKQEQNPDHFSKSISKQTEMEKEYLELKKEFADVKMERDILKKAVAIFSKP